MKNMPFQLRGRVASAHRIYHAYPKKAQTRRIARYRIQNTVATTSFIVGARPLFETIASTEFLILRIVGICNE